MSADFDTLRDNAKQNWDELETGHIPSIRVGTGICGRSTGALAVYRAVEDEINKHSLKAEVYQVGCIGLCYAEPLIDIKKAGKPRLFFKNVTPEMVPFILESYLDKDDPNPDLTLGTLGDGGVPGVTRFEDMNTWKHQVRVATRNCGTIDPCNLDHYIARGGYEALSKALETMSAQDVLTEVSNSGLRGRGGAAFPTGTKWSFLSRNPGQEKYILVNSEEGDPGAFNDKGILESDPHTLIEGTILAGFATGASYGYVFIRHGHEGPINHTRLAISDAKNAGLLGKNILGSGFSFDIEVALTGESYVSGEETALMEAIEGKRAMPRSRPPFPAQSGLWGKPSNINNVKTLAYVPEIIRNGSDYFSSIGYERSKGTAILCLSGAIQHPGMYEVPFGLTLGTVLNDIGGGVPNDGSIKMLQTGGPLGGLLGADSLGIVLDFEHMAQAGAILGSGGIIIGDENVCTVDLVRNLVAFCQFESCGKCFPCRLGMTHLVEVLDRIGDNEGLPGDRELMESMGLSMSLGSLCGHGQLGFNPVSSAIRYFPNEFYAHIKEHSCLVGNCPSPFYKPSRTRPMATGGWYVRTN